MERESKKLEYKEKITNTFLKTVSAYANYDGGIVIFGVTDDLKQIGIENPVEACLQIEDKINDSIDPNPSYNLEIDRKTNTIKLEVSPGINKPYFYKSKAYKRNDSSTIEVDKIELRRLIMEGDNTTFDSLVSTKQDLNFSILEKSLKNELGIKEFDIDILKTLQLYKDNEGYNNAANLLSDNNSFIGIECIRFGKNENEIMDRETYENFSIIEQFNKCMNIFNKYYEIEVIDGKSREKIHTIPEIAFREAIANAIIHRTYDVNSTIKVKMFEDHIEIISPGSLTFGISEEDYKKGKISVLRNPIIGEVFYRLKYIEKLGTGIQRINNLYKEIASKPEYIVSDNYISVKLPCVNKIIDLNDAEEFISKLLENGKKLSRAEIEKYANLGKDKTIRILNSLTKKKAIVRTGTGRNIKYEIIK